MKRQYCHHPGNRQCRQERQHKNQATMPTVRASRLPQSSNVCTYAQRRRGPLVAMVLAWRCLQSLRLLSRAISVPALIKRKFSLPVPCGPWNKIIELFSQILGSGRPSDFFDGTLTQASPSSTTSPLTEQVQV